jgi:hypothetical protein
MKKKTMLALHSPLASMEAQLLARINELHAQVKRSVVLAEPERLAVEGESKELAAKVEAAIDRGTVSWHCGPRLLGKFS